MVWFCIKGICVASSFWHRGFGFYWAFLMTLLWWSMFCWKRVATFRFILLLTLLFLLHFCCKRIVFFSFFVFCFKRIFRPCCKRIIKWFLAFLTFMEGVLAKLRCERILLVSIGFFERVGYCRSLRSSLILLRFSELFHSLGNLVRRLKSVKGF